MNQRGDRRGAFHGVRQPYIQRNLRRLAASADHQEKSDSSKKTNPTIFNRVRLDRRKDSLKVERTEMLDHQK